MHEGDFMLQHARKISWRYRCCLPERAFYFFPFESINTPAIACRWWLRYQHSALLLFVRYYVSLATTQLPTAIFKLALSYHMEGYTHRKPFRKFAYAEGIKLLVMDALRTAFKVPGPVHTLIGGMWVWDFKLAFWANSIESLLSLNKRAMTFDEITDSCIYDPWILYFICIAELSKFVLQTFLYTSENI